jgi:hypothetical protein
MADLVTVKSYPSRMEAEIAKGLLTAYGINCVILADDAGGMRPFPLSYSFGVELKVAPKDIKKSNEILTDQKRK